MQSSFVLASPATALERAVLRGQLHGRVLLQRSLPRTLHICRVRWDCRFRAQRCRQCCQCGFQLTAWVRRRIGWQGLHAEGLAVPCRKRRWRSRAPRPRRRTSRWTRSGARRGRCLSSHTLARHARERLRWWRNAVQRRRLRASMGCHARASWKRCCSTADVSCRRHSPVWRAQCNAAAATRAASHQFQQRAAVSLDGCLRTSLS